jgi:thioredoxin-like negative regulator of GroEL
VGKVNVHENLDLAQEYQVYSIPRVLLFNRGRKPQEQRTGLTSEKELARMVNSVLGT